MKIMNEKQGQYYIYGRTSYEKPLTFIKEIGIQTSVTEETLADVGQDDWIELIAIPADSMIQVIGEEAHD